MKSSIHVLGAGIVGISCALELQRRGYRVTLIDRRGPGKEASSGNAGLLSYSNITPLASPALLPRLPKLMTNLDNDFRLHYPHLLQLMPWMLRFMWRCRRDVYLRDGAAMNDLTQASVALHRQWIDEFGAGSLAAHGGGLKLYRERRSFRRDALERELLQRCGVRYRLLDRRQIEELEPDLQRVFEQGVLIEDTISIRDPEALCRSYAQAFVAAGGRLELDEARDLQPSGGGWELVTGRGREQVEKLVICLGAATSDLLRPLGYPNPLAIERGYHMILEPAAGKHLGRPIFDVDASYVMSPMAMGYRVSSGSNLVHAETRPDPRQLLRLLPRAREAFPLGRELLSEPWMGRRPTLPDTLPIIGPAPRHSNLWLAFGHSHMGFTLGPISGLLIANFVDGSEQPFAVTPCDPRRYL